MRLKQPITTRLETPMVILVGVIPHREKAVLAAHHLDELAQLVDTAQMGVAKRFLQREQRGSGIGIGKGKVGEIADYIALHKVKAVILDKDLKPGQMKQLKKHWKCDIWDRSMLILRIFNLHARTSQAKTQVKLAEYKYLLPRLTGMWSHHSRQQGGIGSRGPGEKELETDKRIVQDKIKSLTKKLNHIEKIDRTKRKQRQHKIKIALVGYTNAGKSSVMHYLAKEEVYIADELFATLGSTVRKITLGKGSVLLSDTVGFIRKLPHELIECFRSTLAEVCEASLLLHVVDLSNPCYEEHIEVVHQALREMGADKIPMVLILNKKDKVRVTEESFPPGFEERKEMTFFEAVKEKISSKYQFPTIFCSILHRENADVLKKTIGKEVDKIRRERIAHSQDEKALYFNG